MENIAVDTGGMFTKVAEQGALFAFMLLVIVGLCLVIRTLWAEMKKQGADVQKALIDSTIAVNNNTAAVSLLTREVERLRG